MRIIWCHSHFLNWMGGHSFVFEVTKRLSKKHEVIVAASVFSKEAIRKFASVGVKTIQLNNKSTGSVLYWLNLKNNIRAESEKIKKIIKQDDVIISSMFPMNCVAKLFPNIHIQCCWEPYALFHDKNYIAGFSRPERLFIFLLSVMFKSLDIDATKRADKIITLSKFSKKWIEKVYGRADALISYEGVDTEFFRETKNSALEKKYKNDKIIFHSTDFTSFKGTDYLIRTFPKILKVFPKAKLLISNTIEDPDKKKKYLLFAEKMGFTENIKFLGRIDYDLLPAYYSLADVVVQPSINQNMSLPIKEAMACQTPIVTSLEGREQTPDGVAGFLVNVRSAKDLSDAVVRILRSEKTMASMGKSGREIVLKKFTWGKVVNVFEKTVKVFDHRERKPFFSIVTCTHNSEKFLARNLKSISSQTFKNYEHILVDGLSKDRTPKLISTYKKQAPNLVRVYHRKPRGISDAMNFGIQKARGKYIMHLHSDDCLSDMRVIQDAYDFLWSSSYPDWIYGKIKVVESSGKAVGVFPNYSLLQKSNSFLLKIFNFVPHQSTFVKKSVFEKFGKFDIHISSEMDYDFWLRVAEKTKWLFFDRIISNYSIHPEAQSSSKSNTDINNLNERKIIKKHLNIVEYILHGLVKIPLDFYNKTLR